ncbi:MAG TPA: glycosyltransferase [bacterium]
MNIVMVSAAYPLRGGIAQHAGILYNKLKQRGHDVCLITFKRQYPKIFFPGKSQTDTRQADSIKIPTEPLLDSLGPWSWIKSYRRIRQLNPDLLIFKYWMPFFAPCYGVIARLVKKNTGTTIVFLCHNVMAHERRIGDTFLTKFALQWGDFFVVQSEAVKKQLLDLFPKADYRLVPHPLFEIFGEPMEKAAAKKQLALSDEHIILFFGYVKAYKGLDLVLQAMPEILKKIKLRLLVVGEFYQSEVSFRQQIADLHIEEAVTIRPDFVANEEVSLYFAASNVVVLPYRSATQSGIVQIAYQLHKPCIVTDVGGLAEVVIDNQTGFVVPPEDHRALADAVVRFFQENKEHQFVENVKLEKSRYSWDFMVETIENLHSE